MKETLAEVSGKLESIKAEVSDKLTEVNKEVSDKLTEVNTEISDKLGSVKGEIFEKIHSENVKCYRNIQTLVEELEKKLERTEIAEGSMKTIKGYMRAMIILTAVNVVGIAGVLAFVAGLI